MEDIIVTPRQAAGILWGRDTKSTSNMVRRMCQEGRIKHASKVGNGWRINATREWPELFGREGAGVDGEGSGSPKVAAPAGQCKQSRGK